MTNRDNEEEIKKSIKSSRIPEFYKLSIEERGKILREFSKLSTKDLGIIQRRGITLEEANRMVENVVGFVKIPLGIATNFLINGKDYLIPMATEEPSVIAAASNAAKIARENGGFKASSSEPIMIGQIQLLTKEPYLKRKLILQNKEKILKLANEQDLYLVKLGGGAKDLEVKLIKTRVGEMLIVHLLVDCRDAMGANVVNTMCESVSPYIERITEGKTLLKIVSNLANKRIAKAEVTIKKESIGGEEVVDAIVNAYEFAFSDPYRAATHNKGIMNGVTAVALATGNDTRALEAGAHAYASIYGEYKPLSSWFKDENGNLVGKIELPIAAGIIGGATSNSIAKICLKILNVKRAKELAEVMASVGLAQNFAALKALATEGIQKGHMRLHARNIAQMAGANDEEIDKVVEKMVKEKKIRFDRAKELLIELRREKKK